jgi:hypothetical protein
MIGQGQARDSASICGTPSNLRFPNLRFSKLRFSKLSFSKLRFSNLGLVGWSSTVGFRRRTSDAPCPALHDQTPTLPLFPSIALTSKNFLQHGARIATCALRMCLLRRGQRGVTNARVAEDTDTDSGRGRG